MTIGNLVSRCAGSFQWAGVFAMLFISSSRSKAADVVKSKEVRRPNIIFIVTDDQRWDMPGCMGNNIIKTPNIDRLANQGVRFTRAFVTTPISAASRATFFTGLYERTHDYTFGKPPIKKAYTDLSYPVMLRHAGYRTGFVGKFGVKVEVPVDSLFSYKMINGFPYWKTVNGKKTYLTDLQGDQAIQFIKESAGGQPFCLSLSTSAPHADDDSKEQYFYTDALDTLYRNVTMPVPSTANPAFYAKLPHFLQGTMNRERWFWRFDTPEKYQTMVKGYYKMITGVDIVVGRIRDELDKLGIADNTIIILMGDNGYYLGDRGYADKWLMHDVSIRVPLVIYDPRKPATGGKVVDQMVMNVDIPPTILEYAGIKVPEKLQGFSLTPLIKGRKVNWRSSIFCEHLMNEARIPNSECVRTDKMKFIRYPKHPEFVELYDLENDPWEEKNLADRPEYKNLIIQFQSQMNEKLDQLTQAKAKN